MVHTRHSRDVEVDSPPRFLSLEDKRSRKSRSHAADANEQDSDHSGIVYENKDHSIFEEKVVESRLRPRTGPRRAYNYVYADSSDDEMMSRQRRARILTEGPFKVSRHSKQHRIAQEPSSDEEEDIGQERSRHWCSNTGRRRGRPPHTHKQINHHDSQKREQRAAEGVGLDVDDEEDDDDEDDNNSALRRSSRLRQKPYRFRPANADESEEKEDNTDGLDREKRRHSDPNNSHEEFDDMYSRVKRARTRKAVDQRHEQSASNSDGTNDDDKNDSEDENQQQRRSYSLREHKPRTQLYIAPAIEAIKKKPKAQSLFRETPPRRVHKKAGSYRSPAHRKIDFSRKRQAFHGSSSSTSSDPSDSGTETSDEQRFNRRKAKSMAKSRSRICPLNFTADMVSSAGVLKDRVRTGASLADVDPMEIDRSVTFASVGGLQKHIMALKEMVVFPLLYPEFYEHFKVAPSRGVLFYGPPGTGKTLVARALANECSRGTQKVAFFMRKGADCLSKWVGEAERQLRLLFDKAYEMRPSIIFFDEIDGLAPVRSSRQDQIHSSIVSTLLALMDGIDSRGEIVVIGATNRIDSIDPALRRPGRFDREFHFPLPNLEDRKKILKIHTKNWNPSLRDDFLSELAEKCSGYCGADVKSLVTEASQNALRRHYPQIYTTSDKLQLDISSITLTARDFAQAINTIVPAAQRAVPNPALALEESIRPLLTQPLKQLQALLAARFPYAKLTCRDGSTVAQQDGNGSEGSPQWMPDVELASDEEDNVPSIFLPHMRGNKSHSVQPPNASSFLRFSSGSSSFPVVFRPRMLVSGAVGQGQTVHLAPAALHLMEHMPVHTLSSATLFAASAKMPEEACSHVFHEAMRTAPSIIYMPYINELWGVVSDSLRVTFLTLIRSMSPSTPVLMMATSETAYRDLDEQLRTLFSMSGGEVMEVKSPAAEERRQYFTDLILHQTIRPPPTRKQAARRVLQPLAKAAAPEPRRLTEREQRKLIEQEEDTLRELRIFLRDILSKLGREKKFYIFTKPVDIEEVPDYYEIIKNPMDLSTMMANIDLHKYNTASAFLDDIFLICSNALEYNPDHGPTDRAIRHRACSMRDMAQALLKAELDPEFEKLCQEITESRKRRGVDSSKSAPAFYHTRPLTSGSVVLQAGDMLTPIQPQTIPEGCRYSRRVRGLEADRTLPLEAVERTTQVEKTLLRKTDKDSPEMEMSSAAEETLAADAISQSKHAEAGENKGGEGAGDQALEVSNGADPTSPKDGYDRALDCKCPGSKDPSPSHSGKSPKGSSSDSKHLAAKRASIRKKCPWLATRRRRRILHPTSPVRRPPSSSFLPSHSQSPSKEGHQHRIGVGGDRRNCQTDMEERFRVETMEAQRSPSASSKRGSDSWDDGAASSHRSRREYSPVSAANPANVSARIVRRNAAGVEDSALLPPITSATTTAASGAAAVSHQEESGSLRQCKASETSPAQGDGTTKVARSLDVELMVVTDSGVSSESNGDSRDSLDHNNSNRTNTAGENESRLPVNGEDVAASTSSGPSVRTRTRTQNPLHMNALAELEVETRCVEVDKEQLAHLLDTTVKRTQGFSVERLQQLYSVLSCAIFSHRLHFNKMPLIREMEDTLDRFCRETEEY